jgi:hypothetical protein
VEDWTAALSSYAPVEARGSYPQWRGCESAPYGFSEPVAMTREEVFTRRYRGYIEGAAPCGQVGRRARQHTGFF